MTEPTSGADPDEWFQEELDEEPPSQKTPADPVEKYAASQLRVVRESKDYQLDYIRHALQPGRELIDVSPTYQRRLRWNIKKKSLLIESFLLNIPVPPIFMFERDYNEYEVIDGRQRLDAIRTFLADEFQLSGLEYWSELNGTRFKQLPQVLQRGLLRRSLPAVVLLAETQSSNEFGIDVRHALFDRLNTGGVSLNPQELRNALYPGPLNGLLIDLSRSQVFTDVWDIPPRQPNEENDPSPQLLNNKTYASLADAELVLRFFALRDALDNNKAGSLRSILDKYMELNANIRPEDLQTMRSEYLDYLTELAQLFDGTPFRLPESGRLSRPLYDSLMIAYSREPNVDVQANSEPIRLALREALANDQSYDVLVGRGNTISAVKDRVRIAGEILRAGTSES